MKLHYKKAMETLSLSSDARKNIQEKMQTHETIPVRQRLPRRWAGAAAATCLAAVLLSTGAAGAYGYFFHDIPDEVAGSLKPVKLTHTSQDITMTVQYASVEEGTLSAYLTLEDISGEERLAQGVDFYHSYRVNKPAGAEEVLYGYRPLGYDEESHTYGFLVQITPSNQAKDILYFQNQQYTFSIGQLLLAQSEYEPNLQPDWHTLPEEPGVDERTCFGWNDVDHYPLPVRIGAHKAEVLQPGGWGFPVAEGFEITAAGFLDNGLHIQLHYEDKDSEHDFGNLTLTLSDGTIIGNVLECERENSVCAVDFYGEDGDRYTEFIFNIMPEDLEGASLGGSYLSGGYLLDGDWEVTFSVEQQGEEAAEDDENPS